ncbi:MAG: tryptophan transporter [Eggerthellaceae bacterium]
MAEKRIVSTTEEQNGFAVRDLILIAVLLAAGAVLKLTVSSFLSFAGMKPNFMIAMYCLAIILTRPKVYQAAIIGLITGLISQIPLLNATPLVNIASELVGAVVCGVLVASLVKVAADNKGLQNVVFPLIITFISTVFSGYTFALIVGVGLSGLGVAEVLVMYAVMVLGTATMNAAVAAILTPVLRSVLKR